MHVHQTAYPISWFRDRNIEQSLILKPPYQRKPVWSYLQKAYLLDTIIRKYHIPEIYIHRETNEDGDSIYNIVDGQQRIRTILDFIAGEDLLLSDKYNPEYSDYSFVDLPQSIQADFWGYLLYVREITNASEEDVRNMFKRMNKNVVPLNAQELRHATYSGEFIKLMENLSEDEYWSENKIVSPSDIRRMNDVQFISNLFISMMHGIQDKTKEMNNYYEIYEKHFHNKNQYNRLFQQIISFIMLLFHNIKEYRWSNKSDFYSLFIALVDTFSYIPIENIENLSNELIDFSCKINQATKKENKGKHFPVNISKYSNAVTKSTTDKDRRLERHKILLKIINKYVHKG